jgi:hypothetical protein
MLFVTSRLADVTCLQNGGQNKDQFKTIKKMDLTIAKR